MTTSKKEASVQEGTPKPETAKTDKGVANLLAQSKKSKEQFEEQLKKYNETK